MKKRLNIVFLGVKEIGYNALKIILERKNKIVAIITTKDTLNNKIIELGKDRNIPVFTDKEMRNKTTLETIKSLRPERGLSFSYPRVLDKGFLNLFSRGCINFHPAILPKYRGCYPTIWPILNRDKESGYTIHYMNEGIDTGKIIKIIKIKIKDSDTGYSLYNRLAKHLMTFLKKNSFLVTGPTPQGYLQEEKKAGYYKKELPNNGQIDLSRKRTEVYSFIKALNHPVYPAAYLKINRARLEILEAKLSGGISRQEKKRQNLFFRDNRLLAYCSDGWLEITKVRHKGKCISGRNLLKLDLKETEKKLISSHKHIKTEE